MINGRGTIFHPLFAYHPRAAVESSQQVLAQIHAPTGAIAEWVPGTGMTDSTQELVWEGFVRVQPDKDWRARARMQGNEFDAVQAVRVQLGIGKNLYGATEDVDGKITYGVDPIFKKDFVVTVMESAVAGTQGLVGMRLYVRNAINSTTPWTYNLLCDAGTK